LGRWGRGELTEAQLHDAARLIAARRAARAGTHVVSTPELPIIPAVDVDPYVYPSTDVLRSLLDMHQADERAEREAALSAIRIAQLDDSYSLLRIILGDGRRIKPRNETVQFCLQLLKERSGVAVSPYLSV
jgi:hypothetical protein